MQRAFVVRPFGKKAGASGTAIDFEQVHEHLIAPALKDAGLGGGTTGEIIDATMSAKTCSPKRRSAATNRMLRKAYEAYRKAYLFDLNHYWSGLAALQQGTITLELERGDVAGHIRQRRPSAGRN